MEQKNGVSEKKVKSVLKKTKIRRRYLCGILTKKRTKVGCCFSYIPDEFLLNKIPSKSKMLIPGSDVLFNQKSYLPENILNMKEIKNKQFPFPTENIMDAAKLKSCSFNKVSRSSALVNSSSRLHKVQMQILKLCKRNQEIFSRTRSDTTFSMLMRTKSFGGKVLSKSMFDLCHSKSKCEEDNKTESSNSASYCSFDLSDPPSQRFSTSKIHPTRCSKLDFSAGVRSDHNLVSPIRGNSDMSPCYFRTIYPTNALSRHENKETLSSRGGQSLIPRSRGHSDGISSSRYHPISTIKARERNYLRGRVAVTSLLGSSELERSLPHRELRIFVGTWNMNGQVPQELNDFLLPPTLENVSDVIVVGTQESFSERVEWEVRVQETVGPSHLLYHSTMLGSLHLVVFIRRDLIWFCSLPEDASYSIRPATSFKTKGAVAIGFVVFGSSYLFIASHLSAHTNKIEERIYEVKKITRSLDLPKKLPTRHKSRDVTQNFDYVFWCGDLNFRLSESREEIMHWVKRQNFPLHRPSSMQSDQLKRKISEGVVFRDFHEGPITFPPTYKYNLGSQIFDTSHKQRSPAYTDRILYKCRGRCTLKCLRYTSVQSICTSDHKPVWALYTSVVRPGIDSIPLAAGLFNRDVYLEAVKRRATAMDGSEQSAVCSIQ